jgi:hypothetical protein
MNEFLRLYFESIVRLSISSDPGAMKDEELVGVVGLLPNSTIGYAEWSERTGIGKREETENEELTEEAMCKINDAALHAVELRKLESNAQRNAE